MGLWRSRSPFGPVPHIFSPGPKKKRYLLLFSLILHFRSSSWFSLNRGPHLLFCCLCYQFVGRSSHFAFRSSFLLFISNRALSGQRSTRGGTFSNRSVLLSSMFSHDFVFLPISLSLPLSVILFPSHAPPSHPLVSHHLAQLLSQFPSFAPTHASAKVLRQNAVSLVILEQFLRYRGSSFRILWGRSLSR